MCHDTKVAAGGPSSHKDHFKASSAQSPESRVSYMTYLCGPWNILCSVLVALPVFLPSYRCYCHWS